MAPFIVTIGIAKAPLVLADRATPLRDPFVLHVLVEIQTST